MLCPFNDLKKVLVQSLVVYGVVVLMVVCNAVVYSVVVLLVVRELLAAITGSRMGSSIGFGAIFGKFSWRRKMDKTFSSCRKRKSYLQCFILKAQSV